MSVIEKPRSLGLLTMHSQHQFSALDVLKVPVASVAVVDRAGELEVYREGDQTRLAHGLGRETADVYFVDLQPTQALEWGTGNLMLCGHICGAYGSLQLQVASERKLVGAFRGKPLPLTAEKALEHVWDKFVVSLRRAADDAVREVGFEQLNSHLKLVAQHVLRDSEETMEEAGLAVANLFIEEFTERPQGGAGT